MGVTVRQDPKDQCWYVHVTHQNRRKARKIGPGREGERNAHKVADVARGQIALDTFDWWAKVPTPTPKAELTLAAYVARWLKSASVTRLKVGTQEKYEETMRTHWLPDLGTVPVCELTRDQIKDVLEQKSRSYSKNLLLLMASVLGACLNAAIEDKLIAANPAARLGKVIGGASRKAISVFEPQDLAHLLTTCRLKFPHIYSVTLILARTGMRIGEALTLKVGDIDLAHYRVWVRRTWGSRKAKVGERRINTPKNGKERGVDLSDQLADVLRAHVRRGKPQSNAWLFPSSQTTMPWLPDTFRSQWALLLKETRLPYRNPHVLRHTYASLLLQNGESLEYVMRQLGHSSIKITVDTYGHLVPSMNRRAVNRLDEICK